MDISKGRYWDKPWSLVDGCTPCSPGCDHCWSAAISHRFNGEFTGITPDFNGIVRTRTERLSIPLKRRKPTVWAVWNDLFHEAVPDEFQREAFEVMRCVTTGHYCHDHTFLVLTKRPQIMADFISRLKADKGLDFIRWPLPWVYLGLTVCNQAEADEKIPVFLRVPGKKYLSIEPMLGAINLQQAIGLYYDAHGCNFRKPDAVILGGETGPGARPMHPDWVRSVRDQCAAAGIPFFMKCNGEFLHESQFGQHIPSLRLLSRKTKYHQWPDGTRSYKIGKERANRLFDGRTHDDLPWRRGNDTAEI